MRLKKLRLMVLLILIGGALTISTFSSQFIPHDPNRTNVNAIRKAPNDRYPWGTDHLGRCVFSRVVVGAKTTIGATLLLVLVTFVAGCTLGVICGYFGGFLDHLIMRLADLFLSVPQMVLAVAIAGIMGGGMFNALMALGFTNWIVYARLAKTHTEALKEEDFIKAAKLGGHTTAKILMRYVLPNILGPLMVCATNQFGLLLMGLASLSFLGLGVQAPHAEWGRMISESRAYIQIAPWAVIAPSMAIVISAFVFYLLGDTTKDVLEVT